MLNRVFSKNNVTAQYSAAFDESTADFDLPEICQYLKRGAKSSAKNKQDHTLVEVMITHITAVVTSLFNKGSNIQNANGGSELIADFCKNINILIDNNYVLQKHEIPNLHQLRFLINLFDNIESPYNTSTVHTNLTEAIKHLNEMLIVNAQEHTKKITFA